MRPFERTADGRIIGTFGQLESELISDFASQVSAILEATNPLPADRLLSGFGIGGGPGPSADPAIARLLPDAYLDDAEASEEFRHYTEQSLASRKIDSARLVVTWLAIANGETTDVDAEAQQAWLRTLTNIRLVIAARLGIEVEGDTPRSNSEEEFILGEVYDWLAMVQETLLDAMES